MSSRSSTSSNRPNRWSTQARSRRSSSSTSPPPLYCNCWACRTPPIRSQFNGDVQRVLQSRDVAMVYRRLISMELLGQVGHLYPFAIYNRDNAQSSGGFLVITQDPLKLTATGFGYSRLNLTKIHEIFNRWRIHIILSYALHNSLCNCI